MATELSSRIRDALTRSRPAWSPMFARFLKIEGVADLTMLEMAVLFAVEDEEGPVDRVAETLRQEPNHVRKVTEGLVSRRLVDRVGDNLRLSEEGRRFCQRILSGRVEATSQMFGSLPDAEQQKVAELFEVIARAAQGMSKAPAPV